jgi:hypothetical protein
MIVAERSLSGFAHWYTMGEKLARGTLGNRDLECLHKTNLRFLRLL